MKLRNTFTILFILLIMQQHKSIAQLTEFGFGYSPSFLSATRIESFDPGDAPTYNSVLHQERTLVNTLNLMIGIYYPIFHPGTDFSIGANYEAIGYVGKMDGGYLDALVYGIDLPVYAEVRYGFLATLSSKKNWGISAGAGIQYSAMEIMLDDGMSPDNEFIPALNAAFFVNYSWGLRLSMHTGTYQSFYESNTGGIPRTELTKYHLTAYFYLGKL